MSNKFMDDSHFRDIFYLLARVKKADNTINPHSHERQKINAKLVKTQRRKRNDPHSKVMTRFQARMQKNPHLGELLADSGQSNPATNNTDNSSQTLTIGQKILAQLQETGYLGCFSDKSELSENYKEYLDLSDKI